MEVLTTFFISAVIIMFGILALMTMGALMIILVLMIKDLF